jgi:hypothetical protein
MIDSINGMLGELPKEMDGLVNKPAAGHLFEVSKNGEKLLEAEAELYHHNTAKLLFSANVLDRTSMQLLHSSQ